MLVPSVLKLRQSPALEALFSEPNSQTLWKEQLFQRQEIGTMASSHARQGKMQI